MGAMARPRQRPYMLDRESTPAATGAVRLEHPDRCAGCGTHLYAPAVVLLTDHGPICRTCARGRGLRVPAHLPGSESAR